MRARRRYLTILIVLLAPGTLAGCSDSPESQKVELERLGYSNVKIVSADVRPYVFSATVNRCTVHLFIAQDKDVWYATIDTTANGKTLREQFYPPGYGTFMAVGSEKELRSSQRFVAICP